MTIQLQNFVLQETNGKPFASFDNFSVQVNTRQSVKNLALVIDNITLLKPIDFKLTGYSNKTGVKLPFQLNAGINKTGSIQINGDTTLEPFTAQLTVNAHTIALESLQPYLEKVARLDLIDGQFAIDGKFAIALPDNRQ